MWDSKGIRLSQEEIACLKEATKRLDPEAQLYLFGSRANPHKKGGDIDLLIVSTKLKRKDLRRIRLTFYDRFEEQKIDIVLDNGKAKDPFIQIIKKEAILL